MNGLGLYEEALKHLPAEHIDYHESDLYIKVTDESRKLVEAYRQILIAEYGTDISNITTFRSIHPDDKDSLWYEIPFHYTPFWKERGCQ
jgi:hypothetical protein